jgi:hypothetical protein
MSRFNFDWAVVLIYGIFAKLFNENFNSLNSAQPNQVGDLTNESLSGFGPDSPPITAQSLTLPRQAYAVTGDSCFTEECFLMQALASLTSSPQA